MYQNNEKNKGCYTNYMIYIPKTPFTKDDNFKEHLPNEIFVIDITASCAPDKIHFKSNPSLLKEVIEKRIIKFLKCAIENKIEALILGSYGCGKCGNEPKDISLIFHDIFVKRKFAIQSLCPKLDLMKISIYK